MRDSKLSRTSWNLNIKGQLGCIVLIGLRNIRVFKQMLQSNSQAILILLVQI